MDGRNGIALLRGWYPRAILCEDDDLDNDEVDGTTPTGIENCLHWTLDVTFREDESRIRKDHGPENFAILRRAAGRIKQEKSKGSVKKIRKRAAWKNDALLTIVKNS